MPDETHAKKNWGSPNAVPVPNPEASKPPWERSNPAYGVGAGKDEKATKSATVRLTTKEDRDLQKMVQHRKYAVIETKSDAIRVALMMFRYWYALNHGTAADVELLDVEMWENERLARDRYRRRVLAILEGTEMEMREAERLGYENRLKELRAELAKYKKGLTDEELLGKANRLYVLFAPKKKS